ncbi:MAG TPA: polysaccharide biosynthesis/export family protein [Gemmatimonadaceae bacterium]
MSFWSLILVLAGVVCSSPVAAAAQTPSGLDSQQAEPTFTLEPGDVVRVDVWREKDLTGDFIVDEVGRLTLPMLGTIHVTGHPWTGLRDSLLAEYSRQLKNPSVTLIPLRRVQVLGEVARPGNYLADPTLSLAGLVALAGGATANGDLHRVRVLRGGKTIVSGASVEDLLLQTGVHSNDQIFIDRRAWLERNGAIVASTIISAAGILITILHR